MTNSQQPIVEQHLARYVGMSQFDYLLSVGWRHCGPYFFRYSHTVHGGKLCNVVPLRVRLADFAPSKSLRRIARRNADLEVCIQPTVIDNVKHELFAKHSRRFKENRPDSLSVFLSDEPNSFPCPNVEVGAYLDDRLIAVSFLDLASRSASSVYAMFDPDFSKRGLGHFTILEEIAYARSEGLKYYYIGYVYDVPSFYDYKKRLPALEAFDWNGNWVPFVATGSGSE